MLHASSAVRKRRSPSVLIRYDVYLNGELRAVVVGNTIAEVEADSV
jgi:hypothetical protein